MRPATLFGYAGSEYDQEFWEQVDGEAAEAFVSFETEDVIYPKSPKPLFERPLEEGCPGRQREGILYRKAFFRGKSCESAGTN